MAQRDSHHSLRDRRPAHWRQINGEPLPKPGAEIMKNQTAALKDAELDRVTGGTDASRKYATMMLLLTSLQQMQHETAKSVIQNIRA
jgi:hypothetical protein